MTEPITKEEMLEWLKFERIMSEKERDSPGVIRLIDKIRALVESSGEKAAPLSEVKMSRRLIRADQPAPPTERCPTCGQLPVPELARELQALAEELKAMKTLAPPVAPVRVNREWVNETAATLICVKWTNIDAQNNWLTNRLRVKGVIVEDGGKP